MRSLRWGKVLCRTQQVTAQWVMEARRLTVAADMHQEDVVQPTELAEDGSEASVIPPAIEPNVVLTGSELPLSSSTDATGGP